MLSLLLGAICFAGIHFGVAGTTLRDRAIAALGEGAYRAVFSIVSLVAIVWLVLAYKDAPSTLGIAGKGIGKSLAGQRPSRHASVSAITGRVQMRPRVTAKTPYLSAC